MKHVYFLYKISFGQYSNDVNQGKLIKLIFQGKLIFGINKWGNFRVELCPKNLTPVGGQPFPGREGDDCSQSNYQL
jgi:hypothetical protein